MRLWRTPGRLGIAAILAVTACGTTTPRLVPQIAPGDSYPNAVADDGNIVRSMSEGGQSNLPYVLDGTVEYVTEHSLLIRSDELGVEHLFVTRDTRVTLDGKPAAFSRIRPGTRIRAAYGPTGLAWALQAGRGATDDRSGGGSPPPGRE
jgi:hypothetical protein